MSHFKHHVFFCLNQREDGGPCCANHQADELFSYMKSRIKAEKLNGKGLTRVNRAGCFDRCSEGPVIVVYPEAVWYTYMDKEDIDEIVDSHIKQGKVVERLKI